MNDHERMMAVLEGSCPDCSVDLEYKEYGGTLAFLKDHITHAEDDIDVTEWQDGDYEIGMIVTKCPECSKRYESYYHKNGDWTVV